MKDHSHIRPPFSKPRIGIDLDDVLFDFNSLFCEFSRLTYGTTHMHEQTVEYDMVKTWKISPEECTRRIAAFISTVPSQDSAPLPGAATVLRDHLPEYEYFVISSRAAHLRFPTETWIARNFPGIFRGIHLTNQFHTVGEGARTTKLDVCRELGIELMIEDCMLHIDPIATAGIPVIVMQAPWNRGRELPTMAHRARSWSDVPALLPKVLNRSMV